MFVLKHFQSESLKVSTSLEILSKDLSKAFYAAAKAWSHKFTITIHSGVFIKIKKMDKSGCIVSPNEGMMAWREGNENAQQSSLPIPQ